MVGNMPVPVIYRYAIHLLQVSRIQSVTLGMALSLLPKYSTAQTNDNSLPFHLSPLKERKTGLSTLERAKGVLLMFLGCTLRQYLRHPRGDCRHYLSQSSWVWFGLVGETSNSLFFLLYSGFRESHLQLT